LTSSVSIEGDNVGNRVSSISSGVGLNEGESVGSKFVSSVESPGVGLNVGESVGNNSSVESPGVGLKVGESVGDSAGLSVGADQMKNDLSLA
jgi:hypothetical protein